VTTPIGGLLIAHLGYSPVFLLAAAFYLPAIGILWRRFGRAGEKRGEEEMIAPKTINISPKASNVLPTANGVNSANQTNLQT